MTSDISTVRGDIIQFEMYSSTKIVFYTANSALILVIIILFILWRRE